MSHHLTKPLLPFSSGTSTPTSSPSSTTSTSLKSYPTSPISPSNPSSTSKGRRSTFNPPRRIFIPLTVLVVVSIYFFHSSTSSSPTSWKLYPDSSTRLSSSSTSTSSRKSSSSSFTPEELSQRWKLSTESLPLESTLEERVRRWELEVPGWEVEPGDWVRKNLETCPDYRIRPNQNTQMLDKSHLLWASMNTSRIMSIRQEMIQYLVEKERQGAMKDYGQGRGLVFTAGNADTFQRVLLTLRMLKNHLHTDLPSEIFSFPGETPSEEVRRELERYGAKFRVVEEAVRDPKRTKNYHIKATAIVRSRFREVLFLDSDNIPTTSLEGMDKIVPESISELAKKENRSESNPWDRTVGGNGKTEEVWGKPTGIWESKAYDRLKVMFWPDYWRTSGDNPIWAILGVPCRDEWEQEAGQILVDKKYHLDALLLAEWMMDSSRFKFWFNFSDGDKDLFRFAFLALRKRWAVPGRYVSIGALPRNTMSGFCGLNMVQHDHLGKPLFIHANLLKQVPSGVQKGFAWGRSRQIRTQPSTLRIPTRYETSSLLESEDPLTDDDVDCDQLANVGDDGVGLKEASGFRTRRRAAMERGIRAAFHGGWYSALCIDYHYDDPRTSEQIDSAKLSVAQHLPNPSNQTLSELAKDVDVCYCAAPDGFELRLCGEDLTEVVQWEDDPRLRRFEDAFFEEGGQLNGKGF